MKVSIILPSLILLILIIVIIVFILYHYLTPRSIKNIAGLYSGAGKHNSDAWKSSIPSNIKVIKELGSGGNGTAFFVENEENKKLILKVEKMDEYNHDKPLSSEYYRQVEFDKLARLHPDKFMTLVDHGIIKDCSYVHPKTEIFMNHRNKDRARRFERKNSQKDCYWLLYEPFLEGHLKDVFEEVFWDRDLYTDYIEQMLVIVNIMKEHGYSQNDFDKGNIMYKKVDGKYQWYLIDYGNIHNTSFPPSRLDEDIKDRFTINNDLLMLAMRDIHYPMTEFRKENGIKLVRKNKSICLLRDTDEWKELSKKYNTDNIERIYRLMALEYPTQFLKYDSVSLPTVEYPGHPYKEMIKKLILSGLQRY